MSSLCLLNILADFSNLFLHTNSVDPDQTAPSGAIWSASTLFAKITKNHKQMIKQTTIVVIGSLRVKNTREAIYCLQELSSFEKWQQSLSGISVCHIILHCDIYILLLMTFLEG